MTRYVCFSVALIIGVSACTVNHGMIDTEICENDSSVVEQSSESEADQFVGRNEPGTTIVTGSYTIFVYEDGYSERVYSPLNCNERNNP
jgi:hypothetical protein